MTRRKFSFGMGWQIIDRLSDYEEINEVLEDFC